MSRSKKIDFVMLVILAVVGSIFILAIKANFLTTAVVFLGTPSIYLILRKTQNLKVILSGVFLIGILLGFLFDFLATYNNAWLIPDSQLTIPYRVFGSAPVDELICLALWCALMLIVYEHFFEKKRLEHLKIRHFILSGIIPALVSVIFIIVCYFFKSSILKFDYAYLVLGLLASVPLIYFSLSNPKILHKIIRASPYFIFLFLIFELTSLYLGHWSFPGQYIGNIDIFSLRFPIEELVFWIVISSTIVLADYKIFVDK